MLPPTKALVYRGFGQGIYTFGLAVEEIEHVFDFSASIKAQIVVTEGWIGPPGFHREPSHGYEADSADC